MMDTAYFSMLAHGWPLIAAVLLALIPLGYLAQCADKRSKR